MFSEDDQASMGVGELGNILPTEEKKLKRLLGILWDPKTDMLRFKVQNNISMLRKKSRTGPDLTREEFLRNSHNEITCCQHCW